MLPLDLVLLLPPKVAAQLARASQWASAACSAPVMRAVLEHVKEGEDANRLVQRWPCAVDILPRVVTTGVFECAMGPTAPIFIKGGSRKQYGLAASPSGASYAFFSNHELIICQKGQRRKIGYLWGKQKLAFVSETQLLVLSEGVLVRYDLGTYTSVIVARDVKGFCVAGGGINLARLSGVDRVDMNGAPLASSRHSYFSMHNVGGLLLTETVYGRVWKLHGKTKQTLKTLDEYRAKVLCGHPARRLAALHVTNVVTREESLTILNFDTGTDCGQVIRVKGASRAVFSHDGAVLYFVADGVGRSVKVRL